MERRGEGGKKMVGRKRGDEGVGLKVRGGQKGVMDNVRRTGEGKPAKEERGECDGRGEGRGEREPGSVRERGH